eukprot:XP_001706176.1 Hypothetical protein GL50803_28015 [Giardia lamblia ATCC 50803]
MPSWVKNYFNSRNSKILKDDRPSQASYYDVAAPNAS